MKSLTNGNRKLNFSNFVSVKYYYSFRIFSVKYCYSFRIFSVKYCYSFRTFSVKYYYSFRIFSMYTNIVSSLFNSVSILSTVTKYVVHALH